jgi:hypothetical protein
VKAEMTGSFRLGAVAAVASSMCVLAVLLFGAPKAGAAVYGFCENVHVGGYGPCQEVTARRTYQDYGWGDLHSVCVSLPPQSGTERCSGGPGAGVYSGTIEYNYVFPLIKNNAAGDNYLHGVYFTP